MLNIARISWAAVNCRDLGLEVLRSGETARATSVLAEAEAVRAWNYHARPAFSVLDWAFI